MSNVVTDSQQCTVMIFLHPLQILSAHLNKTHNSLWVIIKTDMYEYHPPVHPCISLTFRVAAKAAAYTSYQVMI